MPCYRPLNAYRRQDGDVGFSDGPADRDRLELACGSCLGCRLDKARDWSTRCQHEAKLWPDNLFVTLTYDDDHLPIGSGDLHQDNRGVSKYPTLRYRDVQLFLKKLRKEDTGMVPGPNGNRPIRYFVAGEYGERTLRPHYHMLLFNFDFKDGYPWGGDEGFRSETLERLWGLGHTRYGVANPERIAYVSRYALKKVYGKNAEFYYNWVDPETGELTERTPEFVHMSRRPGIGAWYLDRYRSDYLGRDYTVVNGHKRKMPAYYERKMKEWDALEVERAQATRGEFAAKIPASERTPERRATREEVALRTLAHKGQANRGF